MVWSKIHELTKSSGPLNVSGTVGSDRVNTNRLNDETGHVQIVVESGDPADIVAGDFLFTGRADDTADWTKLIDFDLTTLAPATSVIFFNTPMFPTIGAFVFSGVSSPNVSLRVYVME